MNETTRRVSPRKSSLQQKRPSKFLKIYHVEYKVEKLFKQEQRHLAI